MMSGMEDGIKTFNSREEWLQARAATIGGSDAACLLGMNPYKTNVELWREKKGITVPPDISENAAVQYGSNAEPLLRELFKLDHPEFEVFYFPNNLFINDAYSFAHASLDGWIKRGDQFGILEIKTATIFQGSQFGKWNDSIPDNYYCQVLWYMMIMDAHFAWVQALLRWVHPDGSISEQIRQYSIERDEKVQAEIEYLAEAGERFWQSLQDDQEPALILPPI